MRAIAGIVVGVLAVLLLVVIVVAVAAMITFWRTKRKPRNLKLNGQLVNCNAVRHISENCHVYRD